MTPRSLPLPVCRAGSLRPGLLAGLPGCGRVLPGLLTLLAACGQGPAEVRPRNAILISIDTLRPDYLGCYGHPRPTSPTLDALAASGVRFEDVTAAAPWTLPSHATMLTGLYPASHGVKSHETRLPEAVQTVAEEFQAAGFETVAVVNTHNIGEARFQLRQGFQRFRYVDEVVTDPKTMRIRSPNRGEDVVLRAKELLAKRDPAKPLFLFLHFYDTHTDYTPRDEYRQQFVQAYTGRMEGRSSQLDGVRKRGERLEEDDLRFLREMYEAEIRQFDALLGDFFAWLRTEGLLDESLIVVTSDHGEEFQEHGGLLHGRQHFQESLRVPLLVAGPGVPAGVVVTEPVDGVDVTPTLLGVMGLETSQPRDGLDLSPTWRGGALPARTLFAEADHGNLQAGRLVSDVKKMVRRGNEKLLQDTRTGAVELYDLAKDPLERDNLAERAPARVAELRAELERYLQGARAGEAIPPPSAEEQAQLDALGYGGAAEAGAEPGGTPAGEPERKSGGK
jgi:arylsulfatase A-like enzyme